MYTDNGLIAYPTTMASLTNNEYADFLYCYGYVNAVDARRDYLTRLPDRREPDVSGFNEVYRRNPRNGYSSETKK